MIFQINKYHVVSGGETASSVSINKPDYDTAYEAALKDFHQLASNYMADKTVLAWELALIDPRAMNVVKVEGYTRPVQAEETAETAEE